MKKILLLMMCCPAMLAAQNGNGVTVNGLDVKPGKVTFNVSWKKADMPAVWSDSVWVFVDYNNAGRMERLPVADATVTAGAVEKISGNDQGVWVIGNARSAGSFSATVQLLTETADLAGVCAYDLPENYKLVSFTDATGAPGIPPTRLYTTPPDAASTATWTFGYQIWSDIIVALPPDCSSVTRPTHPAVSAEYIVYGDRVYYNWYCVQYAAPYFCPSPWHAPTVDDALYLHSEKSTTEIYAAWPSIGRIYPGFTYPNKTGYYYMWLYSAPPSRETVNTQTDTGAPLYYSDPLSMFTVIRCVLYK